MSNFNKKHIIYLSIVFGFIVLISMIAGMNQVAAIPISETECSNSENSLHLSEGEVDPQDNSTWGYFEWREYIVMDCFNMTEEQLDPTIREDETFQHNLHIITLASWGYYNGTYNEDDLTNLLNQLIHSSVEIEIVATPVHTDQEIWIDVELSINAEFLKLFFVFDIIIGFKSEAGGKWIPPSPFPYVWVKGLPFIPPKGDIYPLDLGKPTVTSHRIKVETGSLEDNLKVIAVATAYIKVPTLPLVPVIPFPHDEVFVDLVDDDTERPIVVLLEPLLSPDYPSVKPVILDSDPYLFIKLYCQDYSGIQKIVATIYHHGTTHQYYGTYLGSSIYGIYVDNPRDLGIYSVYINVYDADLDRGPIDQEIRSLSILFEVIDDDDDGPIVELDTGPPPYHQYYDYVTGKYTFPFQINAIDEESGIYRVIYRMFRYHPEPPYSFQRGKYYNGPREISWPVELELDPGVYILEAWVEDYDRDRNNDRLTTYKYEIIDLLAPETDLIISGKNYWDPYRGIHFFGPSTSLILESVDDHPWASGVDKTFYWIDNEPPIEYKGGAIPLSRYTEGYHTLNFYSTDKVGNAEYIRKTYRFFLDKTRPFAHVHIDPPIYVGDLTYITSHSRVSISCGDGHSGVELLRYKIDSEPYSAYTSPFYLNGYEQGLHSINFYAMDRVGNAIYGHKIVFLDDIPPVTQALIGNPKHIDEDGNIFINDNTQITLTVTDYGSGTQSTHYSIDGGPFYPYIGPISLMNYADGPHTIKFYSVDRLGNQEITPGQLSVILDTTSPETQIAFGEPYYYDGIGNHYLTSITPISLTSFDFGGSGTKSIYYRIDGGEFIEYLGSFTMHGYLEGVHTIEFYSIDNVENVEEPTKSITVIIDETAPQTQIAFGEPYHYDGIGNHYLTLTTPISLTSFDFGGSGIKSINYRIDGGEFIEYSGSFTLDGYFKGVHTIDFYSIDNVGNVEEEVSTEVIVGGSELTYTGESSGDYSDPVILEAILIDIATQLPISGKTIVFTIGDQTVNAETLSDGVASVTLILDQPGGVYSVSASFVNDGEYLPSFDECDFTINKEYAYAEYTGDTVIPTTEDTITLRATVFDEDDGNWGDLTKINVTFKIYCENYILLETHWQWVDFTNVDGIGVAIIEIPKSLMEGGYLIQVSFNSDYNDYYWGVPSDFVVLIIYEPTGDFVTGGGWIEDTEGNKGNFGFNVKYKKNGLPKGKAIYVYREGDYIFIIKSNAWIGMAIDTENNHAVFEAKCNVKKINSITGLIEWEEGNFKLRIDVWDYSQDGKSDIFQICVYDKIGMVFHEASDILQGGNIVIHVDDKKK